MGDSPNHELENHVLVLGTSELTEIIVEELESQAQFLIVSQGGPDSIELERDYEVLEGDPGSRETLERAGIYDAAAAIVAADSDSQDAMSILTAKKLNPSIRIAAAATNKENISKLKRAGADVVISPSMLGGQLMVRSSLTGETTEELTGELFSDSEQP
ncbi:NAD-binding protein [Natronorubrum texcoconense]|uniref:TrkA-N domain-containing protein n=1 Tax=Natronorubrum texcoconense TaxID=1095776 RepID=A0A1G8VMF4_9EURY|nr:NAD-binding protein [Natronorubrum texcoconense]SDJ67192.1 TrkA-N domain-containing protein [Natronorubrum texcoconense]